MTKEQYESLPLAELKAIAKARGMKGTSAMKKGDLIALMLEKDEEAAQQPAYPERTEQKQERPVRQEHYEKAERSVRQEHYEKTERPARQERYERTERYERGGQASQPQTAQTPQEQPVNLDSGQVANGILEVLADGYGFIRSDNYLPGENDI